MREQPTEMMSETEKDIVCDKQARVDLDNCLQYHQGLAFFAGTISCNHQIAGINHVAWDGLEASE